MALRGKKPEDRKQRLKMLLSGPAGVGKTTAAIQMPRPYVIDTEAGSLHYADIIDRAGGVVFETRSMEDIIAEIRSLITEQHDYRTLVIDPITTVYDLALEEGERKVGTEWGRHYGYANKQWKRLFGLITTLDMNVVLTSHEKDEYDTVKQANGETERVNVGKTYQGFKGMDYAFDLWLLLERDRGSLKRYAVVKKTRLSREFPDQDRFEWSYQSVADRYGAEKLEKGVATLALATGEQVTKFNYLMNQLTEQQVKSLKIDKALAEFEDVADMPADRIVRGINIIETFLANQQQPVGA